MWVWQAINSIYLCPIMCLTYVNVNTANYYIQYIIVRLYNEPKREWIYQTATPIIFRFGYAQTQLVSIICRLDWLICNHKLVSEHETSFIHS